MLHLVIRREEGVTARLLGGFKPTGRLGVADRNRIGGAPAAPLVGGRVVAHAEGVRRARVFDVGVEQLVLLARGQGREVRLRQVQRGVVAVGEGHAVDLAVEQTVAG